MAKSVRKVYEELVSDLCRMTPDQMIDAMNSESGVLNEDVIASVPLRYRVIAMGFAQGYTLEELNKKLEQYGCPRLYERNFWEACLCFAFGNGYSYEQWKSLRTLCGKVYAEAGMSRWFRDKFITYEELERYVVENSGEGLVTVLQTEQLRNRLQALGAEEELVAFLSENIEQLSALRERARYYFCKYLYFYLNRRIENYIRASRNIGDENQALEEMVVFKAVTKLKRNVFGEEEKRALLLQSPISCGWIFREFNAFFFEHASRDWTYFADNDDLIGNCSPEELHEAAEKLRAKDAAYKGLSDYEAVALYMDRMDDDMAERENVGYIDGKKAVQRYIRGGLDIDRTVLICFLMFFAGDAVIEQPEYKLDRKRLDEILKNCGYPVLDAKKELDAFFISYLKATKKKMWLMEQLYQDVENEKNPFIYHLYKQSVSNEKKLMALVAPAKKIK